MTLASDLRVLGAAALGLPRAVLQPASTATREPDCGGGRAPVVLLHGYAGTERTWTPLLRELTRAGFGHVHRLSYNSFTVRVDQVLAALADLSGRAAADADAAGVHLVGHSLGGLLARSAVDGGLLPVPALTVATIAAPHAGTPLGHLALGPCGRLLRPGAPPLTGAAAPPAGTTWLAYWSDADLVVPPSSARLPGPRSDAQDVLVPGQGHLTICRDPRLLRHLTAELLRSDERATARRAAVA